MNAHEINKRWGGQMLTSLTVQDAAIVFCLGIKKDGKLAVSMTSDIANHLQKEALLKSIELLQEQVLKMK